MLARFEKSKVKYSKLSWVNYMHLTKKYNIATNNT